jgi:protein-S-isoprenylcysteine O-methyltransferase Ste14
MIEALNAGDVTKLGVGLIVALVVLGVLISVVVSAIVVRLVVIAVVVVLAIFVWQQRTSIQHKIDQHKCNLTFMGVHLDPPDSLNRFCS